MSKKPVKTAGKSEKPETKVVAPKAAKVAKKASTASPKAGKTPAKPTVVVRTRGGQGKFPLTAKITLKHKENPHRKGTNLFDQYRRYKPGMTVEEALKAGVVWANLNYLNTHKIIEIG